MATRTNRVRDPLFASRKQELAYRARGVRSRGVAGYAPATNYNPRRIAGTVPSAAGNVGPNYEERVAALDTNRRFDFIGNFPDDQGGAQTGAGRTQGGGQVQRGSIHPQASSSPAVLAQRAKWAQQEATNKMAGQLHGGAYAMGTIASLAKPGQGAGDPTQAGATQTPEAIAGARAAMAKASPVSSSLTGGQFFPDQEMYSDPTSADTGTQSIYKTRVKDFKDEFMRRATGRSSPFSNIEEFKDFVEKNPSYSPEIGTAAWDFAQTQLKSHAPGLYQEIVGQDKVQEANTLSKSQYLDRAMPGVGEGMTADEKEQYVNENLMDDFSKSGIPEWQYNPATKQIEPVPPSPEIAKQEKRAIDLKDDMERLEKRMDNDMKMRDAGDLDAKEFKRRDDRDSPRYQKLLAELRRINQIELGQTPEVGVTGQDGGQAEALSQQTQMAIQKAMEVLKQPNLSPALRQAIQTKIDGLTAREVGLMAAQPLPVSPRGSGTITDASGNVIASTEEDRSGTGEGIIIDASGNVATAPGQGGRQRGQGTVTNASGEVIASTQPTATPKPTATKEGRRTELIAKAKNRQYDSSEIASFIGQSIKSGLLNAGEKAVKQTMEVASLPIKTPLTIAKLEVRLAKKVGKAVASKFVDSITDKMNEKWVDEQLAKE